MDKSNGKSYSLWARYINKPLKKKKIHLNFEGQSFCSLSGSQRVEVGERTIKQNNFKCMFSRLSLAVKKIFKWV